MIMKGIVGVGYFFGVGFFSGGWWCFPSDRGGEWGGWLWR